MDLFLLNRDLRENCTMNISFSIMTTKIIVITRVQICIQTDFTKVTWAEKALFQFTGYYLPLGDVRTEIQAGQEAEAEIMEQSCLLTCSLVHLQLRYIFKSSGSLVQGRQPWRVDSILLNQLTIKKMIAKTYPQANLIETIPLNGDVLR